jgi:Uma2 family endonuclease
MTTRAIPPLPLEVLLTAEEFLALPEAAGKLELHDGQVVEVAPARPRHSAVQGRVLRRLGAWCDSHGLGEPAPELTCRLSRRRVVIPDVAYVRPGPRWDAALAGQALDGSPDLAVEVVSPGDSRPEVRQKVQWYLAAGCSLVWVVNPQRRTATVYRPGAEVRHLTTSGVLDGEDVLPGFRLPLADLWVGEPNQRRASSARPMAPGNAGPA